MSLPAAPEPVPVPVAASPLARDSALNRFGRWSARLADRCNPILVRVVRQELRNRTFVIVFVLLLTGAAIASLVAAAVAANSTGAESGDLARGLFGNLAAGWAFSLLLVQPLGCFRAIAGERNDDTWDLVELTGMRPVRVVGGLLQASLVQGLLYTSALAPFMVMAYLLRGLDLIEVLFVLVAIPATGVACTALAVFMACLGPNKASRGALSALLGLGLIWLWCMACVLCFNLREVRWLIEMLRADTADALLVIGIWLNLWGAHLVLMLVLSSALLAFRAANRSTGPRLAWFGLWFNALLWVLGVVLFVDSSTLDERFSEGMTAFAIGASIHACLLALFAVSEDYELSPRQARAITGAGRWRWAMLVFGPGAARGRLAWLAMAGASIALGVVGWVVGGCDMPTSTYRYGNQTFHMLALAWTIIAWMAIVTLVADRLYRGVCSGWFPSPPLRRGFILLITAVWMVLPPIAIRLMGFDLDESNPVLWASPATAFYLATEFKDGLWPSFLLFSAVGLGALLIQLRQGLTRLRLVTHRVVARDDDANPRRG